MFKQLIKTLDTMGEAVVEFIKLDGTKRVMFCTWGEKGMVDGKLARVFDVEAGEYRSIRAGSIIDVR